MVLFSNNKTIRWLNSKSVEVEHLLQTAKKRPLSLKGCMFKQRKQDILEGA